MEPHDLWPLDLVEVADDGAADHPPERVKVVGFGALWLTRDAKRGAVGSHPSMPGRGARRPGSGKLIVVYYLLLYELVDDYMERRPPFREEHLRLAREAKERGELVLAGAYADPPDGAALVFRTDDDSVVRDFVAHDPYVREGLVERWAIRRWTVVIGER